MVGVVKGHVVLVLDHPAIFAVVINITVAAEAAAPVVQCDVNAGAGRRPPGLEPAPADSHHKH
jgi:hypothetical protein